MWKTNRSFPTCCGGDESPPYKKRKMGYVKALRARTLPRPGPVREGGRDFRTGRPDELTRWARAGWLLEHSPLPEAGTISGDIQKAPGILKGPAGPLSRAPRLGSSGDFFGSFLVGQKGTFRNRPAARIFRSRSGPLTPAQSPPYSPPGSWPPGSAGSGGTAAPPHGRSRR